MKSCSPKVAEFLNGHSYYNVKLFKSKGLDNERD